MKNKTVLSFDDLRDDFSRYEVRPRSANQHKYWNMLKDDKKSIVIAHGPAGCGKTLLATQNGIDLMKLQKIEKIVITRPVVGADEEIGFLPDIKKTLPLESFISHDSKFHFHTYLCVVQEEFIPKLNIEHNGYAWCSFTKWPKPLHHGLRNTLQSKINLTKLDTVFQTINLLDK